MIQVHSSSLWLIFSVAAYSYCFRVSVYIHLALCSYVTRFTLESPTALYMLLYNQGLWLHRRNMYTCFASVLFWTQYIRFAPDIWLWMTIWVLFGRRIQKFALQVQIELQKKLHEMVERTRHDLLEVHCPCVYFEIWMLIFYSILGTVSIQYLLGCILVC